MLYNAKNFFSQMKDKKIDVIGFGVSNSQLVFKLADSGALVTLHDKRTAQSFKPEQLAELKKAGVSLSLGESYLEDLKGEIIFRTPGLPFNTAELTAAREKGQVVTSELEVFMKLCPCVVYGVTGSDGKTTTASILAEMLRKTGRSVYLGGNIGKPLLPLLEQIDENGFCVVELSSFQLLSMRVSPDVAIVTNLSPNHLDVHGTMEEYKSAKLNILQHQSAFSHAVISLDSKEAYEFKSAVRGRLSLFSRRQNVSDGVWLDENGDIFHSAMGRATFLMNRCELRLPGLHNVENFMAAAAAAWGVVTAKEICEVASEFSGVEHRIEFVREKDGVKWYNDSIATSPTRMIAGLNSFDKKLIVIAGGYDKKIPFETLAAPVCEHVKTLVLTGPTAKKIEAAVKGAPGYDAGSPKIIHAGKLAEAVAIAAKEAQNGDIVTLSPACASFDEFANFEARGRAYKQLVNEL